MIVAVEGVALPDSELIYQALRFLFWSAGQGVSPINTDDAPEPEEALWQYSLRTGDEDWETVADRYRASLTTPPARSYADGVEDAAKVLDARVSRIKSLYTDAIGMSDMRVACEMEAEAGAAAIRLLSQGGKA